MDLRGNFSFVTDSFLACMAFAAAGSPGLTNNELEKHAPSATRNRPKTRKLGLSIVAGAAAMLALPALSHAAYSLGEGGTFGVLSESTSPGIQINNGAFTGNFGIGNATNGNFSDSGPGTLTGNVSFAGPTVSGDFTVAGNVTFTGSAIYNDSTVTSALSTVNALSTMFAGEAAGTPNLAVNTTSTAQTVNASNGVLDGSGNEVFTLSSFNIGSHGLTINGTASQFVVFDINVAVATMQGPISLTGGITSDQVLFNITNSNLQSSGNETTNVVHGVFLDPNGTINMNEITIDGRVFGGGTNNLQLVSNFTLNTPPNDTGGVPEPASLSVLALGAGALLLRRRRRA